MNKSFLMRRDELSLPVDYVVPDGALENRVCQIFADIFKLDRIGADDDFFDLGGDSLQGEELSLRLKSELELAIPLSHLFDNRTPRQIAGLTRDADSGDLVKHTPKRTLWLIHGRDGYAMMRPTFEDAIGANTTLKVLELPGLRGDRPPMRRVEEIARSYANSIEKGQPDGPVNLGGFCSACLIAIETAHILRAEGREVSHLILIDPLMIAALSDRHQQRKPKFRYRLVSLALLGSADGVATKRAFESDRVLFARFCGAYVKELVRPLIDRLSGTQKNSNKKIPATFSRRAITRLRASYSHYWPKPYDGKVAVLVSKERLMSWTKPNGWNAYALPNAELHQILDQHNDIQSVRSGNYVGLLLDETDPTAAAFAD